MRRCLALFIPAVFFGLAAQAQLVNDGATIKIQPGAVLFIAGNVENKNSGTISNDGRVEVQGNFLNTATYTTATADDSLILSGATNVTVNAGASTLSFLHINKAANANTVTLAASLTIGGKLTYSVGSFSTDPATAFTLNAGAAVPFEFAAGREIIGRVRRTGWSNGVARVFNQPNMQVTTNAGTTPTEFTVFMVPNGDPTQTEREVKRRFQFSAVGGSGYTANARFPYVASELNTNVEANIVPWNFLAAEWNSKTPTLTRDAANDWVNIAGIANSDIIQEWKLADPRYTFTVNANMRGAWSTTDMINNLAAIVPLSQPYTAAPFSYPGTEAVGAIPANVVDWVLVQFRKPANGLPASATSATEIGTKAAFILRNGSVINTDGTPLWIDIRKQGAGFFVLRHRNHIAAMSNSLPSNATGTYANDFRLIASAYVSPSVVNAPMTIMPGSTQYGLWAGDANADGGVNGSDLFTIRQRANLSSTGYEPQDVNMDGGVNGSDLFLARQSANQTIQTHSSRGVPKLSLTVNNPNPPKTHVPL